MKTKLLLMTLGLGCAAVAMAQENGETIAYESVSVTEINAPNKTVSTNTWRDNWFMQLGAGIQSPFVENYLRGGGERHHITAVYNAGFGHWFSPYLAARVSGYYGNMRWDCQQTSTARLANVNVDLMWDMFNSLGGVSNTRVFSIVPFVGIGGTYLWHFDAPGANIYNEAGKIKHNEITLPVSAGLQLRFRMCKYADFFVEGRASFNGDNFDNTAFGNPIDINLQAIGGITVNFGGREFDGFNPCDYLGYMATLNNEVNNLRGALAVTQAALADAEAQLPCPEVKTQPNVYVQAPMLSAVRFTINSDVVTPEEMVNVYNVAQWMKDNPTVNVVVKGYADKDTGNSSYNMQLSKRRAENVAKILTNDYNISPSRLTIQANGSDTQPYSENDWNRIVIFAQPN